MMSLRISHQARSIKMVSAILRDRLLNNTMSYYHIYSLPSVINDLHLYKLASSLLYLLVVKLPGGLMREFQMFGNMIHDFLTASHDDAMARQHNKPQQIPQFRPNQNPSYGTKGADKSKKQFQGEIVGPSETI